MGIRRKDRTLNEPKPFIAPQPIEVNDDHYRGLHPDDIAYPLVETVGGQDGTRSLELRAFTRKGLEQLRRIANEQFLPALDALGLNCAVLCEKRRDSGARGRITLGACFNAGRKAQESGQRQLIMLRQPDADSPRVAAVLLHEMAHLLEDNHAQGFRKQHGEFIAWAVGNDTPFSEWRKPLLALAKGDSYRPIPPMGSWDDYAAMVEEATSSEEVSNDSAAA